MIQNENNRAQMVKLRFLREFNIKVIDEWLSGCVSFCLQENPKTSNESLFQFAYSQWLLADLNEMQYLIDISEPAYDQWRDLHDKKMDEAEDEVQMRKSQTSNVKKRRMLKLELTDGKQVVVAMEHSPISCLNTKLAPGLKLLLSGPIRCINKVFFLEPRNVRVLGGEVDVLLITNAYENVLLRVLNKPANPNPKLDYEEADVSEGRSGRPNYKTIESIPMPQHRASAVHKVVRRNSPVVEVDDVDDSLLMGIDLNVVEGSQPEGQTARSKPEQVAAISTLMDDDDMDELVQLVEEPHEPEIMNHQVSSTKHSQPSPVQSAPAATAIPSFDEPFEDDIDMMNELEDEIQSELQNINSNVLPDDEADDFEPPKVKKPRAIFESRVASVPLAAEKMAKATSTSRFTTPVVQSEAPSKTPVVGSTEPRPSTSKAFNQFSTSALFDDSMDGIEGVEQNHVASSPSILSPSYAYRIDDTNLATIEQIMALPAPKRRGASFFVYCEVHGVTEQPRIRKDRWHLQVELTDHSDVQLPVRLHDGVISKMVHHDAADLMRMHKTDRNGVMKLLDKILFDLKELLQEIKCFWRVVYDSDAGPTDSPTIMQTYNMNEELGAILLDKIIKENCSQLRKML